ncbi:MAG TPA: iron-sulfur cluster carrier protein ApbC [Nitrococcus sp.]|nr:iron-sulfur cluster carrier protein ApbC [Nitrococcus sp.]
MAEVSRPAIEQAIQQWIEPYLGTDLLAAGAVKEIATQDRRVRIVLRLGFPAERYQEQLRVALIDAVTAVLPEAEVTVEIGWQVTSRAVQTKLKPLANVHNIIAVASAKGGVGKSTVAANLALALAGEGARVGVLDADIYGPSQPRMMGVAGRRPQSPDGKHITPLENYGVQIMSIGFLIEEEAPMVWRGPMVTQALIQLLNDTQWQDLDYLVVDLPPGTGDIQLTLAQRVPVSGALVVTTPQDIATLDARKGIRMFRKVKVPVLGVLENMSTYICSQCGHEEHIFGEGGGSRLAQTEDVLLIGALPLDSAIREQADSGRPSVVAQPEGRIAELYRQAALRTAAQLSRLAAASTSPFPRIVVED